MRGKTWNVNIRRKLMSSRYIDILNSQLRSVHSTDGDRTGTVVNDCVLGVTLSLRRGATLESYRLV